MKNLKIRIILSVIIFLSVGGSVGIVNAEGVSLYISPAIFTGTSGNVFNVHVGFNTSGIKVCAVEGTLVFNNLSCQSITVVDDVIAQSLPTCSNPHFLINIPNCVTSVKILLTVSVKAGSVGTASIIPTGVDIIGEHVSAGTASRSGNYTINAAQKPISENNLPANVGVASLVSAGSGWDIVLWGLLVLAVVTSAIYIIDRLKGRKK